MIRTVAVPNGFTASPPALRRSFYTFALCALLGLGSAAGPTASKAAARGRESFRETCIHVSTLKEQGQAVITATCKSTRGGWNNTTLRIPQGGCVNIENYDGRLNCIRYRLPRGTWSESCERPTFDGQVFSAVCKGRNGEITGTLMDMSLCPSNRLENVNGSLRCQ